MPIHPLPPVLVSQIAAGEVIESPVGVVKELVENSLDAAATQIEIYCREAGFTYIQVRDNGSGISREDLPLALEPFYTSKISTFDDLFRIYSLGFRGEALAAIRSVSKIILESKASDALTAWKISAIAEKIGEVEPSALPVGTRVVVEDLFFNTPVRLKFMNSQQQIRRQILEVITNLALANFSVSFQVFFDGKEVFHTPAQKNLTQRVEQIYGTSFSENLLPIYYQEGDYTVEGYISNYSFYRTGASDIRFFVNRRSVQFKRLVGLLREAYGELMPAGRFPVAMLFLQLPAQLIDINVHPQKKEIRFREEAKLTAFLQKALRDTIEHRGPFQLSQLSTRNKPVVSISGTTPTFDFLPAINFTAHPAESLPKSDTPQEHKTERFAPSIPNFVPQAVHARLFDTFLLASSEEGIFLIDQHTAHERINYENFLKKLKMQENVAQQLAIPFALVLSPAEKDIIEEKRQLLQSIGFVLEDLGPAGWSLLAVPFYLMPGEEEQALRKALKILEEEGTIDSVKLFDKMAKNLACRQALKKGDSDSVANLAELVTALSRCEVPGRCPHGRPTMVFWGRKEIFYLFKRSLT